MSSRPRKKDFCFAKKREIAWQKLFFITVHRLPDYMSPTQSNPRMKPNKNAKNAFLKREKYTSNVNLLESAALPDSAIKECKNV